MDVLAVIHGDDCRSGTFGEVARDRGHALDEWSLAWGTPSPRPLDAYGAVMVFGGAMHADQDAWHPWLRDETVWLQQLLARRVPLLGICLGVQLLARAAGSWVGPTKEPEIGWYDVELTEAGRADPVFSALPQHFKALESHYYAHGLPDGAVELARSTACLQGFRLGDACWGVQFHPEVTEPQLNRWAADKRDVADPEAFLAETRRQIGTWNELGRRLCDAFLVAAEERAVVRR